MSFVNSRAAGASAIFSLLTLHGLHASTTGAFPSTGTDRAVFKSASIRSDLAAARRRSVSASKDTITPAKVTPTPTTVGIRNALRSLSLEISNRLAETAVRPLAIPVPSKANVSRDAADSVFATLFRFASSHLPMASAGVLGGGTTSDDEHAQTRAVAA